MAGTGLSQSYADGGREMLEHPTANFVVVLWVAFWEGRWEHELSMVRFLDLRRALGS